MYQVNTLICLYEEKEMVKSSSLVCYETVFFFWVLIREQSHFTLYFDLRVHVLCDSVFQPF